MSGKFFRSAYMLWWAAKDTEVDGLTCLVAHGYCFRRGDAVSSTSRQHCLAEAAA